MNTPLAEQHDVGVDTPDDSDQDAAWTEECNELLGQVLETQTEIASLLQRHEDNTKACKSMKQQCDKELLELQQDAWKLQMFVELQRMGEQLEQLATNNADNGSSQADVTQEGSPAQQTSAYIPASSSSSSHQPAELEDLDREIAELDKQLAAARLELQALTKDKAALAEEVQLVGEQLEAAADGCSEGISLA